MVEQRSPKPRAEGSSPSAPAKNGEVSRALTSPFFVSVPNVLATRCGCALRSACRGASACQWHASYEPTEPAGETSPSFYLHQAKEEPPSLSLLCNTLSHPFSPASNRPHPLQHPERTRFRLFRPKPGAFRRFCPLLTCKICGSIFVHCANMPHRLKPSVIPCRREVSFLT